MKTRLLFLPICLGFFAASASAESFDLETERDIREAAYRYQFDHNISGLQKKAAAYFLVVVPNRKGKDPSDEFLKRFIGNKPPVKKMSQSGIGKHGVVIDKATGKRSLAFSTGELQWISPLKAQIEAGYGEGNMSAGSNTYLLEKKGQKWFVVKDIKGPVS